MNDIEKPSILVCTEQANELILKEVLAGMEEEGIPYSVVNVKNMSLIKETYNSAQLSRMGIAVGILRNRVIIHYNKLREINPLFDVELKFYERERARSLGNNAARLYKAMPLKDVSSKGDEEYMEFIKDKVIAILRERLSREG
ncbi:glycerol dehydratase reactivase beta/small subunit family protein [Fonticella tunisiensis]|uniref:Dehydratase medium subunit n=1 Tax=Fonticella tunisiensis TaxID=1096341 RepID=A0A4R7K9T5_9CLOT|nr:glycerol dehydratase reactivase beta/small subunit family protein [Fonticella tunisiensis]TDT50361.1 dehydratase medium subunit [Fonticella tunisiensis]